MSERTETESETALTTPRDWKMEKLSMEANTVMLSHLPPGDKPLIIGTDRNMDNVVVGRAKYVND